MTKDTNSLDEQIDEILAKFAIQILGQFTGATALGVDEFKAKDTIKALIADEVKKARIDELKQLLTDDGQCICQLANQEVCDHNWSLCNTVNDRIAELQSTKPSNKSKE